MQTTTLYSTRETIPKYFIDFFKSIQQNSKAKNQCENDIHRKTLSVGGKDIQQYFMSHEYKKNPNKFEYAKSIIQEEARTLGIQNKDAEYFSLLMTSLCNQAFCALRSNTLNYLEVGQDNKQSLVDQAMEYNNNEQVVNELSKKCQDNYKLDLYKDKLIYTSTDFFFYKKENDIWSYTPRNIHYTFYPDKTMQMSMENPEDPIAYKAFEYFTMLTTDRERNLEKILQHYTKYDPYNLFAMDCDQQLCKKLTWLINHQGYKLSDINNDDIESLYNQQKFLQCTLCTASLNCDFQEIDFNNDIQKQLRNITINGEPANINVDDKDEAITQIKKLLQDKDANLSAEILDQFSKIFFYGNNVKLIQELKNSFISQGSNFNLENNLPKWTLKDGILSLNFIYTYCKDRNQQELASLCYKFHSDDKDNILEVRCLNTNLINPYIEFIDKIGSKNKDNNQILSPKIPKKEINKVRISAAIESLINGNSYTIARLIAFKRNSIQKNNSIQDQCFNNELYKTLSPKHQSKINEIAIELQNRHKKSTITDCLDIVIHFFRLIGEFFGSKTAAVRGKDLRAFLNIMNDIKSNDKISLI